MLLQSLECFGTHSAFADYGADAEFFDNLALIRLFADTSGRACRLHMPAFIILQHHRPAVIDDCSVQINRRLVIHQILMQRVASGVHFPGENHYIAYPQAADILLVDWRR
ncbi:hypothetical protein D3C71_1883570 [compost metagenome]